MGNVKRLTQERIDEIDFLASGDGEDGPAFFDPENLKDAVSAIYELLDEVRALQGEKVKSRTEGWNAAVRLCAEITDIGLPDAYSQPVMDEIHEDILALLVEP